MVTSERWQRIEVLFHDAEALPPERRQAFLERACADEPGLREQVERLLNASDSVGDRFERLIDRSAAGLEVAPADGDELPVPDAVGPFRILRPLGHGGMGTVYLAEQTTPLRRHVALKMLHRGTADESAIRRFEAEAQALARMSHPAIAQIYDAGTTDDGRPYLVMERVDGEPLIRYCDRARLGLPQRLEIFRAICLAVQHAHDRGVLHRDLKPSNLLVAEEQGRPLPKIIDFGIAKALGRPLVDDPLHTGRHVPGTPAYMSPEALHVGEAGSAPPEVRSDVYSLGVVLYELLSGVRPFEAKDPLLLAQEVVRGETPPVSARFSSLDEPRRAQIASARGTDPSGLRRRLRGSLGRIVSRATASEPAQRHTSAGELAAGIERYLHGRPLTAAPRRVLRGRTAQLVRSRPALAGLAVLILALAVLLGLRLGTGGPRTDANIASIAVLPLEDLSPGGDQGYLSDGITEALIVDLAKIGSLKVISRTSVMRFKGTQVPLPEIARQLAVDAVVEGSVLRTGEQVRITAQLIDGRTDTHLWSETYERQVRDVLALQRQVARTIVDEIRLTLTPDEERRLARVGVVDPAAYESYLRGRYFWNRRTEADLVRAIEYFRQAGRIEPEYAPAYAGLADCYALLTPYGGRSPDEVYPEARRAALRALELDSSLGAAHASLALVLHEYDWAWEAAGRSYRRALQLDPSYATARQWYAESLSRAGSHDEAVAEARRAVELDPLSLIVNSVAGWILSNAGRYDEAIEQLRQTLELDPRFFPAEGYLGVAYLARGDVEPARRHLQRALELAGDNPRYVAELGVAQAAAGDLKAAQASLDRLQGRSLEAPVHGFHLARLHLALGDRERALESLEEGYRQRGVWMLLIATDPLLRPLAGEPRFQDLLERIGFPGVTYEPGRTRRRPSSSRSKKSGSRSTRSGASWFIVAAS